MAEVIPRSNNTKPRADGDMFYWDTLSLQMAEIKSFKKKILPDSISCTPSMRVAQKHCKELAKYGTLAALWFDCCATTYSQPLKGRISFLQFLLRT